MYYIYIYFFYIKLVGRNIRTVSCYILNHFLGFFNLWNDIYWKNFDIAILPDKYDIIRCPFKNPGEYVSVSAATRPCNLSLIMRRIVKIKILIYLNIIKVKEDRR